MAWKQVYQIIFPDSEFGDERYCGVKIEEKDIFFYYNPVSEEMEKMILAKIEQELVPITGDECFLTDEDLARFEELLLNEDMMPFWYRGKNIQCDWCKAIFRADMVFVPHFICPSCTSGWSDHYYKWRPEWVTNDPPTHERNPKNNWARPIATKIN